MSDNQLLDRIDSLDGADYTDPATYANLLGYNEPEAVESAPQANQAETETAQSAAPAATEQATESSAPAAAVDTGAGQEAAGVATKDGKRVIPYAVLHDEREARKAAAARVADLERQLTEALKPRAQATQEPAADTSLEEISDEEVAEIEVDLPIVGKLSRGYKQLASQLEAARAALQQASAQPAEAQIDVQPLIDERPLLAQWQAKGGKAWQSAIELDNELRADPAWGDGAKSIAERFAEVERRLADEFGITTPTAKPAAAPAAQPAKPLQPKASTVTPTLSDFGGSPAVVGDKLQGMSVGQQVDAVMGMSMEEIRRMAGLSY